MPFRPAPHENVPVLRHIGKKISRRNSYAQEIHGRQRGRRVRKLCLYRSRDDLPHHAVQPHGQPRGRVGRQGEEEPFRHACQAHGNAGRGRRLRRHAGRARGGRSRHDLHLRPGPDADDPADVPHRGPAAAGGHARGSAFRRDRGRLHLRRPPGRDGLPPDRLGAAGFLERAGVHGPRRGGAPVRHQGPRPRAALLRRLPHLPRDPEDRRARL